MASRSIAFEKELFAIQCRSVVEKITITCFDIMILDGKVQRPHPFFRTFLLKKHTQEGHGRCILVSKFFS